MRIKGWKKIFKFTYLQSVKSKSFKTSTIIICVVMALILLGVNFIPLMSGSVEDMFDSIFGGDRTEHNIDKLYLNTDGELTVDMTELFGESTEVVSVPAEQLDETRQKVKASTGSEILMQIIRDEYGYQVLTERPESEEAVTKADCGYVNSMVSEALVLGNYLALGIAEDDLDKVEINVRSEVVVAGEVPESELAVIINVMVSLVLSVVLFIFIFSYGMLVAQTIAVEKTSKLMETLLTSVQPLAIIVGKITATFLMSITQVLLIGVVAGVTFLVSSPFGILGQMSGMIAPATEDINMQLASVELQEIMGVFNFGNVVLLFLIFVLGFLFFALLAGLFGSTVTRAEDLQQSLQPLSLIAVLGFYLAYFPAIFQVEGGEANFLTKLSYYAPISSPFALPSGILTGQIGTIEAIIAVLVLLICDALILLLVARVYEQIILYSGDKLTIKKLLGLAKKAK